MKISKHIHSCLLVQDQEKTILIDPGNYSYDEKALDINQISNLDAIVITHEHQDHMYIPWIKEILQKFPGTPIFTTESAKKLFEQEGITNVNTEGNEFITLRPVPHEAIWMGPVPENVLATLFGKLTTPGDSHTFTLNRHPEPDSGSPKIADSHKGTRFTEPSQVRNDIILALPVQAPWGSTTRAVELALELRPKVIIPIHDWHWRDEARKMFYQRLKASFAQHEIDFKPVETGEVIEV